MFRLESKNVSLRTILNEEDFAHIDHLGLAAADIKSVYELIVALHTNKRITITSKSDTSTELRLRDANLVINESMILECDSTLCPTGIFGQLNKYVGSNNDPVNPFLALFAKLNITDIGFIYAYSIVQSDGEFNVIATEIRPYQTDDLYTVYVGMSDIKFTIS
jgi:hypothetical protein